VSILGVNLTPFGAVADQLFDRSSVAVHTRLDLGVVELRMQ
jgi:hypothetical protein